MFKPTSKPTSINPYPNHSALVDMGDSVQTLIKTQEGRDALKMAVVMINNMIAKKEGRVIVQTS